MKNGVPYTYHNSMFVSPTYPSVCNNCLSGDLNRLSSLQVKVNQMRYYLIDGKGRELVSIAFPVMITEKDSKQ